ncbi:hypothetical protein RclHR1_14090008 [Rhizophagus clarus]|uniref:BTB domain-containing protein n=1 Tax=Rhizophagus clarus TaxID=94130 RepID=A0A2Z6R4B2_9GLOM|nr:hypothetical protein RclHR1_14090008 [Rhizophagus clarus]GES81664.1 hypothetical protein GLOIN_2v1871636 [Rhizophagus clarus]
MALIFHSSLSKDLSLILNDSNDFNVIIQVGENQNMKEFRAHSIILNARSAYFKGALSNNWITKRDNMIMFSKPNITPKIFEMILIYLYSGELDLTEKKSEDILELLVASDEMLFEELFNSVQDYLIQNRKTWLDQNYVLILNRVHNLDTCMKLQECCVETIYANMEQFVDSKKFLSFNKDALYCLFKYDSIHIKEIIAWNTLIEWGINQISKNHKDYNNENYEDLKIMLEEFIPLIEITKITSEDFYHKVRPYKSIIPINIYEEAMVYYYIEQPKSFDNINIPRIESKIIKSKLANIIVNWIDKKYHGTCRTKMDPVYKFNLVYRGSRDGIDKSFKCEHDDKKKTLVLVKIKQSNKIFGGYSSNGFFSSEKSPESYHNDSFIFTFENNEDTQYMKLGRGPNFQNVYNCDFTGFNFSWNALFGREHNLCVNYYYLCKIVEEIETFTITSAFLERIIS